MNQIATYTVIKDLTQEVIDLRNNLAAAHQLLGRQADVLGQVPQAATAAEVTIEVLTTPSGVCHSILAVSNGERTLVWTAAPPVKGEHRPEAAQVMDWMGDFDIALHRPAFDALVQLVANGASARSAAFCQKLTGLAAALGHPGPAAKAAA